MVEGYYPEKPNSYILYLDANNLYGWTRSQPMPTGDFQWEDYDKLAESILEDPIDSPECYILEVDLESPKEQHEEHNAYPPAPERMLVQKEWMTEYQYGLGNGVVILRSKSWFPTSTTRNATCFTTAICSSTYQWVYV